MTKSDKIIRLFTNLFFLLFIHNIISGLVRGWWNGPLDGSYLISLASLWVSFGLFTIFRNKMALVFILLIAAMFIAPIIAGIFREPADELFGLWFRFDVNWFLLVAISGVISLSLFLYQRHRRNRVKSS